MGGGVPACSFFPAMLVSFVKELYLNYDQTAEASDGKANAKKGVTGEISKAAAQLFFVRDDVIQGQRKPKERCLGASDG